MPASRRPRLTGPTVRLSEPAELKRPRGTRVLRRTLEDFLARFPIAERRAADPVGLVHRYRAREDREVAALVASSLAFGRASSVVAKAGAAMEALGPRPARTLRELPAGDVPMPDGWVHRWIAAGDLRWMLGATGELLRREGSLERALRAEDEPSSAHLLGAMRGLVRKLRSCGPGGAPPSRGAAWLLPVPDGRAAAKRACLLLRWMARPADGVDLGLWRSVPARRLTIPLDTHVARIGRLIGLTDRRSADWTTAREVTATLARIDADDPTRFDFALSHLGIMGGCPSRRQLEKCASCDLVPACRL